MADSESQVTEFRYVDIRYQGDGRTIEGVAVPYGKPAAMPWGPEIIEAGAFGDVAKRDLILNVMHERAVLIARTGAGLVVTDGPSGLAFRAEVARTRAGDDALELVRTGILRGASVEFRATRDAWNGDTRRVISADLFGFGLADRPAYPEALVEARMAAQGKRGRRALWPLL